MPRGRKKEDTAILQMALVGYEVERGKIEEKIREIQAQLKGKSSAVSSAPGGKKAVKRVLSASARARIAAAQKKRWAEHRKQVAAMAKSAKAG